MALKAGDPAPDCALEDQQGKTVRLSDLRGWRVILYFYPKADTPDFYPKADTPDFADV